MEVNKRIESFVYQNKDEIQKPVTAFISFDSQEGFERAIKAWATITDRSQLDNHNSLLKDRI